MPNGYTCYCDVPWSGTNCDVEMNPCSPNPCGNGAQCESSNNYKDYYCHCQTGFTGKIR